MAALERAAYWKPLCFLQEQNIFGFIYFPSLLIFHCIGTILSTALLDSLVK